MTNKKDTGEQKRKVSVALEYVPGEEAPKIIASGKGVLAEKIIERAKEADVPVYEDSKLANTLSKLEIGDMIPPELYSVVAEILVFVDDMDRYYCGTAANACFYRGEIPQKCPVRLCLRSGDTCKTEENPQDSGRLSCKTRTEYSVCRGRLPF